MRARTFVLAAVAVLAACGSSEEKLADGPSTFKVMTQNLYLGADLDPALGATAGQLPIAVEAVWASVQATDFPNRAKIVATTIQSAAPDIVGLQEVSLWRRQVPGDHLPFPNATEVVYDFLGLLQAELAARGLSYGAVAINTNADIELPGASGNDYRLTDRDVILVKTSVPVVSAANGTYPQADLAVVTVVGTSLPILRGWTSVDFRAGGKTMKLVNTHLEAISTDVAGRQATDIVGVAQPTQQPTVVLGDMNLTPGSPGYGNFVTPASGLVDSGTEMAGGTALTCCWDPLLTSGAFSTRIDLVFHNAGVHATSYDVVDETETTASGLHASDHAGVVVGFSAM